MSNTLKKCKNFTGLIGSAATKDQFAHLVREAQVQTVVISGPGGSGKTSWAMALAAAYLCEHPTDGGACGSCPSCRYFEAQTHPDFRLLEAEEAGKTIPLDQIRSVVHGEIGISPQLGQKRVWLIDGDGLLESGQNALLKVLEEPPAYAFFILTIRDHSQLLPTLMSRAVHIALPRLDKKQMGLFLEDLGVREPEQIVLAQAFAQGLPGKAEELATGTQYIELRTQVLEWFWTFPEHDQAVLLTDDYKCFENWKNELATVFLFLQSLCRDLTVLQSGTREDLILNQDQIGRLKKFLAATNLQAEGLGNMVRILNETEFRIQGNANFEMTICRMLLLLREEITNARNCRHSVCK